MVPTHAVSDADGDPFIGMVVADRYAVLELLGAGSMGTVYRAHQEAMRRDVALKIVRSERLVDPQAKGRFRQEAHATSQLTSRHTVTVFDFGEIEITGDDPAMIDGSLFLAMELLEGESLGAKLKRDKRIDPSDAVRYARHALLSLGEAHEKGVIHRDLKPDNLILLRDAAGEKMCKVLDFGIAKVLTQQEGVDALETQAGTVFGTPRYMSPEQAQGKQLDARSDLYSLGVILYHMLLGKPPYTDGDAVVVMAHHIKTVPRRPSAADPDLDLPPELEDLLMRSLDKDPEMRPQSAAAFIDELDALAPLEGTNASAQMAAVVDTRDPGRSRRVMVLGAAAAAAVGLVAAVAITQVGREAAVSHEVVVPMDTARRSGGAKMGLAAQAASAAAAAVGEASSTNRPSPALPPGSAARSARPGVPLPDRAPAAGTGFPSVPGQTRKSAPTKPKQSIRRRYEKFD